ncbi:hypothetical protein GCM10009844_36270 [Nocardioides koreensis]|uniref:CYTH domain-containing protein n=1 Tax=Nocardioides koreensis TaxID=433651 RepID=A0ABP5LRU7_9ACTN
MSDPSLKYANVERERRWLLDPTTPLPGGDDVLTIVDRYVLGSRLRLRETLAVDGSRVRKLGHKVRLGEGPEEIACTSLYLDEGEWGLLLALPAAELRKERRRLRIDGRVVAVDVFAGDCAGLVLVEIDGARDLSPADAGLDPVAEVTADERFTGGALAAAARADVCAALAAYGLVPA